MNPPLFRNLSFTALGFVAFTATACGDPDTQESPVEQDAAAHDAAFDAPSPPPPVELPPLPSVCAKAPDVLLAVDWGKADPRWIAAHGDEVFVLAANEALLNQVVAVPQAGGEPRVLTDWQRTILGFWIEGADVVFVDSLGLYRTPIGGGEVETLLDRGERYMGSPLIDASHLYWVEVDYGDTELFSVHRWPRGGGAEELLWSKEPLHGERWWLSDSEVLDGPDHLYVSAGSIGEQVIVAVDKQTGVAQELLTRSTSPISDLLTTSEAGVYIVHPIMDSLFRLTPAGGIPEAIPLIGLTDGQTVTAASSVPGGLYVGVESLFADETRRPVIVRVAPEGGQVQFVGCLGALVPSKAYLGPEIQGIAEDDDAVFAWSEDIWESDTASLLRFPKGQ